MNTIPDKFAQWDAAYVLGALSPAERREFEEHLASCPSCQAAVSELAALPGLLAQLSPDDAAMLALADDSVPVPAEAPALSAAQTDVIEDGPPSLLLPKMIKKVRTRRRRIVAAVAGIAAAVILVIGGVALARGCFRCGPTARNGSAFRRSYPRRWSQSPTSFPVKMARKSRWSASMARSTNQRPARDMKPIRSSSLTGRAMPRRSRNGPRRPTS